MKSIEHDFVWPYFVQFIFQFNINFEANLKIIMLALFFCVIKSGLFCQCQIIEDYAIQSKTYKKIKESDLNLPFCRSQRRISSIKTPLKSLLHHPRPVRPTRPSHQTATTPHGTKTQPRTRWTSPQIERTARPQRLVHAGSQVWWRRRCGCHFATFEIAPDLEGQRSPSGLHGGGWGGYFWNGWHHGRQVFGHGGGGGGAGGGQGDGRVVGGWGGDDLGDWGREDFVTGPARVGWVGVAGVARVVTTQTEKNTKTQWNIDFIEE